MFHVTPPVNLIEYLTYYSQHLVTISVLVSGAISVDILLYLWSTGPWCPRICHLSCWEVIWKKSSIRSASTSSPSYTVVNLSWAEVTKNFFSLYKKICFLLLSMCCIDFNCNVSSADNKCREESAKLLGCLVRNCERLILPYVAPVQKV